MAMSVQGNTRRRKCRRRHANGDMCALPASVRTDEALAPHIPPMISNVIGLWCNSGMGRSASAPATRASMTCKSDNLTATCSALLTNHSTCRQQHCLCLRR